MALARSRERTMATLLARNWWALALRGGAAILFGILAFALPSVTLAVLVILFGSYALVDGIFAIVSAIRALHGHKPWGSFLIEGAIGIIIGLITFFVPGVTLAFLVALVAVWAILTGALEIAAAIRLRRHLPGEWLLILTGVLSVLFGILILAAPVAGALVIVWWLGGYALVFGILLLTLALRLRSLHRTGFSEVTPRPV
jgi:uncharacterized membrane protein HdeD (DUF308 family)